MEKNIFRKIENYCIIFPLKKRRLLIRILKHFPRGDERFSLIEK
jgi:hypothetical protein